MFIYFRYICIYGKQIYKQPTSNLYEVYIMEPIQTDIVKRTQTNIIKGIQIKVMRRIQTDIFFTCIEV
jgi:hypothetical protein